MTASFNFSKAFVVYKGKGYLVSGSGEAEVDVEGWYEFYPGRMWLPNGDPGYPDESDGEIGDVSLEEIEETEVEELEPASEEACKEAKCEVPTEEEVETLFDDLEDEFIEAVDEQLTEKDCEFDEDDLWEIIQENQRNNGPDYD